MVITIDPEAKTYKIVDVSERADPNNPWTEEGRFSASNGAVFPVIDGLTTVMRGIVRIQGPSFSFIRAEADQWQGTLTGMGGLGGYNCYGDKVAGIVATAESTGTISPAANAEADAAAVIARREADEKAFIAKVEADGKTAASDRAQKDGFVPGVTCSGPPYGMSQYTYDFARPHYHDDRPFAVACRVKFQDDSQGDLSTLNCLARHAFGDGWRATVKEMVVANIASKMLTDAAEAEMHPDEQRLAHCFDPNAAQTEDPQAQAEADARAKIVSEERAKADAERARLEQEAAAKVEAETRAKAEAEERARTEADAKTQIEVASRDKDAALANYKAQAEARARAEREAAVRDQKRADDKAAADIRARQQQLQLESDRVHAHAANKHAQAIALWRVRIRAARGNPSSPDAGSVADIRQGCASGIVYGGYGANEDTRATWTEICGTLREAERLERVP
jgi:hypothetical protein